MAKTNQLTTFYEGAGAWNAFREQEPDTIPDLRDFKGRGKPSFNDIDLPSYNLKGIDFSDGDFNFLSFRGADLTGCNFTRAKFRYASLEGCTVAGANFDGADLAYSKWARAKGVPEAVNLLRATAKSRENQSPDDWDDADVVGFADLDLSFYDKRFSWEGIRALGQLPFFTASYTTLVLIPIFIFILEGINQQIEVLRMWAMTELKFPTSETTRILAGTIQGHLLPLSLGWRTVLVFFSALLLAVASTIFAIKCPPRILEFSREKWFHEMKRPDLHYAPYGWWYRAVRIVCGVCFYAGGILGIAVLFERLIGTLTFIFMG